MVAEHDWGADKLFEQLVQRYRGLVLYKDSVKLAHRTVTVPSTGDADAAPTSKQPEARDPASTASAEHSIGVTVDGSTLAVISSAFGLGGSCDAHDASPLARVELARQLWSLPHLALRFADEPLASLRGGCGTLVPTIVERVRIGDRTLLRLHLESPSDEGREVRKRSADRGERTASQRDTAGAGSADESSAAPRSGGHRTAASDPFACGPSTMDLFVNPESLLIERVEHVREIAEGVRYEATLEITPERAVTAPDAPAPARPAERAPERPVTPSPPTVEPTTRGPSISIE